MFNLRGPQGQNHLWSADHSLRNAVVEYGNIDSSCNNLLQLPCTFYTILPTNHPSISHCVNQGAVINRLCEPENNWIVIWRSKCSVSSVCTYCKAVCGVCAGCVPGVCGVCAGCVRGVCGMCAGCVPGVCGMCAGCVPGAERWLGRDIFLALCFLDPFFSRVLITQNI
jgi:hypothetical protein